MKALTEAEYIKGLIVEGEHQQQDFKFEISDVCKIAKTLSAFANTDGGRLLIGVKDNGKIAGIRSEEEQYMIDAAATVYCTPAVSYEMQTYIIEGKHILLADIKQSLLKPVYARTEDGKNLAYVRIDDENILATAIHLQVWRQDADAKDSLLEYTDRERQLLNIIREEPLQSLNRYCKLARLSRPLVIRILAKFIRYDVVAMEFHDRQFQFRMKE